MILFTFFIQFSAISVLIPQIVANFYIEESQNVMLSSIIKELSGVSKAVCALRCKRSNECKKAAIQRKGQYNVCLHLKRPDTEKGEKVTVTVLEEFKIINRSKCYYICKMVTKNAF